MDTPFWGLAGWLAFILLAVPYVRAVRHPETKLFAAWMIFVLSFTAIGAAIYALLIILLVSTGTTHWMRAPGGAIAFLLLIFLPALFAASRIIRRAPRQRPKL